MNPKKKAGKPPKPALSKPLLRRTLRNPRKCLSPEELLAFKINQRSKLSGMFHRHKGKFTRRRLTLTRPGMLTVMEQTRREIRGLPDRAAFAYAYSKGEQMLKTALFKRAGLADAEERKLLSAGLGGMSVLPDRKALRDFTARHGGIVKAKKTMKKIHTEANKLLPLSNEVHESYANAHELRKAAPDTERRRLRMRLVSDMFANPLSTIIAGIEMQLDLF